MITDKDEEWITNNVVDGVERFFVPSDVFPLCFLRLVCMSTGETRTVRYDDDAKEKLVFDFTDFGGIVKVNES